MRAVESSSDEDIDQFAVLLCEYEALVQVARRSIQDGGPRGGSVPGKEGNKPRAREQAHQRLWRNYFSDRPVYGEDDFRRRYRMSKNLFLRIHDALLNYDLYFVQKADALGKLGISSFLKVTAALRMLAYSTPADALEENLELSQSVALESLKRFSTGIIEVFGPEYLRSPTVEDLERITRMNSARGFPGMIGSIDCMHWAWKNCPKAWQGQYRSRYGYPTVILEAVASGDLWIWHCFFGIPGSCNDINVLDKSSVFQCFIDDTLPEVQFEANNRVYFTPYYLADGIYPDWAGFMKSVPKPVRAKDRLFAQRQEAVRKDVERAFGVLQARFRILDTPCKLWNGDDMRSVVIACVILHNMIVEDERDRHLCNRYLFEDEDYDPPIIRPRNAIPDDWVAQRSRILRLQCSQSYIQLKTDLIEHIWSTAGDDQDTD